MVRGNLEEGGNHEHVARAGDPGRFFPGIEFEESSLSRVLAVNQVHLRVAGVVADVGKRREENRDAGNNHEYAAHRVVITDAGEGWYYR